MRTAVMIVTLGMGLHVAALPALAHHSFAAEYDANKPITLTGTITRMEWVNPHAWLYIDVTGPDGKIVNWAFQLGDPRALFRMGWKKTDLPVGAEITVKGYLAKDGSHACARNVMLPDGSTLSADSSGQGHVPSRGAPLLTRASPVILVSTQLPVNTSGPPTDAAVRRQSAANQGASVKPIPAQLPAILARVNGETIERWELERAVRDFDAQTGHQLPAEWRDQALRALLDEILAEHLLAQEAQARNLQVAEADLQARMAQIRRGFPDEESFAKFLVAGGMSLDEFQQQTRRTLRIAKLVEAEIEPRIAVQEADVEAFYQENIERFQQGGRSLAEVRTTISQFLAEQQREEKTDAFVVQLRARAKIEIYV